MLYHPPKPQCLVSIGLAAGRGSGQARRPRGLRRGTGRSFIWTDLSRCGTCGRLRKASVWGDGGRDDRDVAAPSRPATRARGGRRTGADPHRPREELPGSGRQAHLRQALVASSSRGTRRATTRRTTFGCSAGRRRRSPSCGRECARRRSTRSATTPATARSMSR